MNIEQMRIRMGEMAAEIDRLNAERDQSDKAMQGEIILCDSLRRERDALLAEREQLIAKEPVAWMNNQGETTINEIQVEYWKIGGYTITPLYIQAVPAQQVNQSNLTLLPINWSIHEKATCFCLTDGGCVVANLVGENYKENAAYIANAIETMKLESKPSPAVAVPDHTDDISVDIFADCMKKKMSKSRDKGRHGWDTDLVSDKELAQMLWDHLSKANPNNFVDIGNFCMMLHVRAADPAVINQCGLQAWKDMVNRAMGDKTVADLLIEADQSLSLAIDKSSTSVTVEFLKECQSEIRNIIRMLSTPAPEHKPPSITEQAAPVIASVIAMWDDIYPYMESGKYPQERLEHAEFNEMAKLRALLNKLNKGASPCES
jgi:hypothetical protein